MSNSRMENGVLTIDPIASASVTTSDFISAILSDLGCSVSDMPRGGDEGFDWGAGWEYFEPRAVKNPDDLPEHWSLVYYVHNLPQMRDCRDLRYKYVHSPQKILGQHPRLPRRGIFCLDTGCIRVKDITANALIWVDEEMRSYQEEMSHE